MEQVVFEWKNMYCYANKKNMALVEDMFVDSWER